MHVQTSVETWNASKRSENASESVVGVVDRSVGSGTDCLGLRNTTGQRTLKIFAEDKYLSINTWLDTT